MFCYQCSLFRFKTWKIDKDGYLIIEGFSKEDNGKVEVYKTRERIGLMSSDSLNWLFRKHSRGWLFVSEYEINKEIGYSRSCP